jgi:hypothetical protein
MKPLWKRVMRFTITNVVGLVSLAASIVFFLLSQQKPLLTYSVSPIRGRIVQSGTLSDLKVLYKETEVQGDISIVYVVFQNQGSTPIEKADILTPILIKLDGNPRILAAIIQKNEKTRSLTEASLDLSQGNSGQVGVAWRILERNDGFVVQITSVGSFKTELEVTGPSRANTCPKKKQSRRDTGPRTVPENEYGRE